MYVASCGGSRRLYIVVGSTWKNSINKNTCITLQLYTYQNLMSGSQKLVAVRCEPVQLVVVMLNLSDHWDGDG